MRILRCTPALLAILVLAIAALPANAGIECPDCVITGPEASCGPAALCGPESDPPGEYTYIWTLPNKDEVGGRCIRARESGTYSLVVIDKAGDKSEPCEHTIEILPEPPCGIRGPDSVCKGEEVLWCGPEGDFSYAWTGPNDFKSEQPCIRISEPGVYALVVTDNKTKCENRCRRELHMREFCALNCPRTPGFWGQQCEQKDNGSTKLTPRQIVAIADWIKAHSRFVDADYPARAFCRVIDPPKPMDQRKQAHRQYAAFMANLASGALHIEASNGKPIRLDPDTPVRCFGERTTIGELARRVDRLLMELQPRPLDEPRVKELYSRIIECLDAINNGYGIGPVCDDPKRVLSDASVDTDLMYDPASGAGAIGRPYPNPFSGATRLSYAIPAGGARVELGVYDIAGRLVRKLASGHESAGTHEIVWDGTTRDGGYARAGVYFIRGTVGGTAIGSRVLYVQ